MVTLRYVGAESMARQVQTQQSGERVSWRCPDSKVLTGGQEVGEAPGVRRCRRCPANHAGLDWAGDNIDTRFAEVSSKPVLQAKKNMKLRKKAPKFTYVRYPVLLARDVTLRYRY